MKKSVFVKDISEDMKVDCLFVIENPQLKDMKRGKFISCTLYDNSGKTACKIWGISGRNEEVERISESLRTGEVYRVSGVARSYNNALEININEGIKYLGESVSVSGLNADDYIFSPVDLVQNEQEIRLLMASIGDLSLKEMVKNVVDSAGGFFEKPAAKFMHHDYRGGLAEHTLEVARFACAFTDSMPRFGVNRDLILAGALLHDIGKCRSFERQGFGYVALPEYDLIGHVTLGLFMLEKSKDSVKIDDVIFGHLMHIIQSHHGEYGEIKPHTGEAWAVHLADYASATLREVSDDLDGMPVGVIQYGKRKKVRMYRFDSTETGTETGTEFADDDDGTSTAAAVLQSVNVTRAEKSRQAAREESGSAADEEGYGSGQTRLW